MNHERQSLYFVTNSQTKFLDFQFLLADYVNLEWSRQLLEDVLTPSLSILVRRKVVSAQKRLPYLPLFVEQTNLMIKAWHDLPGNVTNLFLERMGLEGITKMLQMFDDKSATVVTELAYFDGKSDVSVFRGQVNGRIATTLRGDESFGWTQIFIPAGSEKTYGEMTLQERHKNSSRREVVTQFIETIFNQEHVDLALEKKVQLREQILASFTLAELKSICFDLGIDHEELAYQGKTRFTEEIISYCAKRGTSPQLADCLKRQRPNLNWPTI